MKIVTILFSLLLTSSAFGELTKEDMRAIIREEIEASEKRTREYIDLKIDAVNSRIDAVNTRIDAVNTRIDGVDKRLGDMRLMMIGFIGIIVAIIAIPQIIFAYRDRGLETNQSRNPTTARKSRSVAKRFSIAPPPNSCPLPHKSFSVVRFGNLSSTYRIYSVLVVLEERRSLMKIVTILFSLLLTSSAFGELTKEDMRAIIREEIAASEKRTREYINLKIDSVNTRIDSVNTRIDGVDKRLGDMRLMMIGFIGVVAAIVAVPQIIIAYKDRDWKQTRAEIQELREEIKALQNASS